LPSSDEWNHTVAVFVTAASGYLHTSWDTTQTFYDFHIHEATERYQALGAQEDGFASPTDRYGDLMQALDCLFSDCGFLTPPDPQLKMF
jgi:hypothetical protein